MKRRLSILTLCLAVLLCAAGIDPQSYLAHIKYLASPELRGRGTGTPGLEKAADYIAGKFDQAGLKAPAGERFQRFDVTTNAKLGPANQLSWQEGASSGSATFQDQFIPLNFSSEGRFEAGVVFVGYGITAAEYHYDDYADVDVKGKFVLVMRHEPQEYDENSVFAGKVYTAHSELFSKASNAKMHGALGVLLVNDISNHGGNYGSLEDFQGTVGPNNAGIPFVQVGAGVVKPWLAGAGQDLDEIGREIDGDLKPRSFAIPALKVTLPRTIINRFGDASGRFIV